MDKTPVAHLIKALAHQRGVPAFIKVCTSLMTGADRNDYIEELRALTGHAWTPGDDVFNPEIWRDYWIRTWGARGLLYVWDDSATDAVITGLADEHWRPAEMCLRVTARHEVALAGDGAAALLHHSLPRVRMQALRALALAGDTQHLKAVLDATYDGHPEVSRQAARTLDQMRKRLDTPQ